MRIGFNENKFWQFSIDLLVSKLIVDYCQKERYYFKCLTVVESKGI